MTFVHIVRDLMAIPKEGRDIKVLFTDDNLFSYNLLKEGCSTSQVQVADDEDDDGIDDDDANNKDKSP